MLTQYLYEKVYCKRGDCELYIKEMKDGLMADRMSCNSFLANQFRLFLHAAAYVLMLEAKQMLFAGHETLATATILTFRKRIIWQTAKITELKTKIKTEFQRDHLLKSARFRISVSCGFFYLRNAPHLHHQISPLNNIFNGY